MRADRVLLVAALLAASACTLIEGLTAVPTPVDGGVSDAIPERSIDAKPSQDVHHPDGGQPDTSLAEASSIDHFAPSPPTTIATGQQNPTGITVTTTNAYWVDYAPDGSVMTVALEGGATPQALVGSVLNPFSFVLAPPLIYLACDNDTTAISTMPIGGGGLSVITSGNNTTQRWITKSGANVYWSNTLDDGIWQYMPGVDGGPDEPVTGLTSPAQVAADSTGIYWVDHDGANVMKATPSGTGVTMLATSRDGPTYLAIDALNVYWTATTGGEVSSIPKAGGTSTLISSGEASPAGIAVDSQHVYWANQSSGQIRRAPKGGGGPVVTLAQGQSMPTSIAVAGGVVYWTNLADGGEGSVMALEF
jgi:hypothetical protein